VDLGYIAGILTADKMVRSEETSVEKADHLAGFESVYQSDTICVARAVFRKLEIVAILDFVSSELVLQLALPVES
jgi:hypothetical protein